MKSIETKIIPFVEGNSDKQNSIGSVEKRGIKPKSLKEKCAGSGCSHFPFVHFVPYICYCLDEGISFTPTSTFT
jgi:hypothetical protein